MLAADSGHDPRTLPTQSACPPTPSPPPPPLKILYAFHEVIPISSAVIAVTDEYQLKNIIGFLVLPKWPGLSSLMFNRDTPYKSTRQQSRHLTRSQVAMEELVVKLQELSESLDSARFVPVLQSRKLLLLPQPCCHLSTGDFI